MMHTKEKKDLRRVVTARQSGALFSTGNAAADFFGVFPGHLGVVAVAVDAGAGAKLLAGSVVCVRGGRGVGE